jgi:hypothetical protein
MAAVRRCVLSAPDDTGREVSAEPAIDGIERSVDGMLSRECRICFRDDNKVNIVDRVAVSPLAHFDPRGLNKFAGVLARNLEMMERPAFMQGNVDIIERGGNFSEHSHHLPQQQPADIDHLFHTDLHTEFSRIDLNSRLNREFAPSPVAMCRFRKKM